MVAYRTVSADAIPIVAGVLPADIKVWERGKKEKWKIQEDLKIGIKTLSCGLKTLDLTYRQIKNFMGG